MRIRLLVLTLAALAALIFSGQGARADEVVIGASNSGNYFPIGSISRAGDLYQQVNSNQAFGTSPVTITRISFRAQVINGGPLAGLFNLRVGMSTTAITPLTMSAPPAANRGADFTQVFSGRIAFAPTPNNPADFDIVIDLTTPFHYDPSVGNLLFEIEHLENPQFIGGGGFFLIAGNSLEQGRNVLSADQQFSGVSRNYGVLTRFTTNQQTTPTPEPATMLLLGSGLAGVAARLRRKRVKSKKS